MDGAPKSGNMKRARNQRKKVWRTVLAVAGAVVVLAVVSGSIYLFNYALLSRPEARDHRRVYDRMMRHEDIRVWADSLNRCDGLRDTFITSADGLRLHAFYIAAPRPTDRAALLVHGYQDNAMSMLMLGYMYNKGLGCNVLLPDLRAHGTSEGKYVCMGWKDREDMKRWIGVILSRFGRDSRIVMHGISMGAATTMMTSGEELPGNVRCFVEDCGYTSVWDEFGSELKGRFHLPAFPLLYTADLYCRLREGWGFREASALRQVARCERPMLFIHGDRDTFVPTRMVYPLYDAKPGDKELWIVPGVVHARAYWNDPAEYGRRVGDFVNRYMP